MDSSNTRFRRIAGVSALLVVLIGGLSGVLFLAAGEFRLDWLLDPMHLLGVGSSRAQLLQWGALTDMLGYQVVGQGPPDLVMTTASFGDIDVAWEDPGLALSYRTLASFSRLILLTGGAQAPPIISRPIRFRRGSPNPGRVGSQRAALLATLDAGPTALFFAVTRPERTSALILAHTTAKCVAADDPIGVTAQVAEAVLGQIDQLWELSRWPPGTCRAGPATCDSAGGSASHSSRAAGMVVGCQLTPESGEEALYALACEPAECRMEFLG